MVKSSRFVSIVAAGALMLGVSSVWAQQAGQAGLVNVNLQNTEVANNLARDLKVDVSQIPVTVQVPVGVAANVCGVNANVLAKQKGGDAKCDAKNSSQALNQIVQKQIKQK